MDIVHDSRKMIQRGFTLVELLIVVIILAILAAIVIPQFASTTDDAKLASVDTTLATVRTSVDLYRQQHGDYPGAKLATGATCPGGGTAGTGAANSEAAFLSQMTMYTNAAGQACSTTDATFKFGPYMKKALPADPFTATVATLAVVSTGNLNMLADTTPAAGPGGWKYDTMAGKFIVNLVAHQAR